MAGRPVTSVRSVSVITHINGHTLGCQPVIKAITYFRTNGLKIEVFSLFFPLPYI